MNNLELLKEFDTPTITNVVATYPGKPDICLGLYHPWEGKWYTNESLRCIYPEHGRRVGYAVTCIYGMPDQNFNRLNFLDLLKAIDKAPKPVILAVKQNFPKAIKKKNGLLGGNMMTAFKSVGVVGVLSDGPSRDIDEIRPLQMQYMLTGVCAGHGGFALQEINAPVDICGMDVVPGEIIHLDENGAVKFPAEYLEEVIARAKKLQKIEKDKQAAMRKTTSPDEIARIMKGMYK